MNKKGKKGIVIAIIAVLVIVTAVCCLIFKKGPKEEGPSNENLENSVEVVATEGSISAEVGLRANFLSTPEKRRLR